MKISSDFLIRMKIYTVVLTVLIQLHFFQIKRRASMRQCMDAENLHRRLKKILGQVQAIDRMIDELNMVMPTEPLTVLPRRSNASPT